MFSILLLFKMSNTFMVLRPDIFHDISVRPPDITSIHHYVYWLPEHCVALCLLNDVLTKRRGVRIQKHSNLLRETSGTLASYVNHTINNEAGQHRINNTQLTNNRFITFIAICLVEHTFRIIGLRNCPLGNDDITVRV